MYHFFIELAKGIQARKNGRLSRDVMAVYNDRLICLF